MNRRSRAGHLLAEARAFGELCVSEQSQNLRHLFFLTERSKKYKGPGGGSPLESFERGAVIGAGAMGGGIAWLMAQTQMAPIMRDLSWEAIELGFAQSNRCFLELLKRRKLDQEKAERLQRSIRGEVSSGNLPGVEPCCGSGCGGYGG